MKNNTFPNKTLTVGIIILFVGVSAVSSSMKPEQESISMPNLTPGIIFVLDLSGSISFQKFEGMKNAIRSITRVSCGFCDATDLKLGVVTFTDHAMISVPPRMIDNEYTFQDFMYDVSTMSTPGGGGTQMYTGVIEATGLVSHMIVMTDGNPGSDQPAYDACEAARLTGQKISIAYYLGEYPQYFDWEECTNSDGRYPDQPIGYYSYVSTCPEMRQTVSGWIHREFDLDCIYYC